MNVISIVALSIASIVLTLSKSAILTHPVSGLVQNLYVNSMSSVVTDVPSAHRMPSASVHLI